MMHLLLQASRCLVVVNKLQVYKQLPAKDQSVCQEHHNAVLQRSMTFSFWESISSWPSIISSSFFRFAGKKIKETNTLIGSMHHISK